MRIAPSHTAIFLLGLFVCIGCQKSPEDLAGVKHFYFEIESVGERDVSELIEAIEEELQKSDYLISEESAAKGWPFYGEVERGSTVLKTDMMPPHSNVNRLSPITELNLDKTSDSEHILRLAVQINADDKGLLKVTKKSYFWHEQDWKSFSKERESEFSISDMNGSELSDRISKTLIRYTFK